MQFDNNVNQENIWSSFDMGNIDAGSFVKPLLLSQHRTSLSAKESDYRRGWLGGEALERP